MQHVPAAIAMFDTDMRYLVVSRNWLTTYGLQEKDIIGRSHYEIFPDLPERWKEVHRRCLAGSVERKEEDPFVWQDGNTQWITWEVRPWHATPGVVGGIIIFSQDVTAHKQAEEARMQLHHEVTLEKEKLAALINSIPDEIWFADKDGNFTLFNPAACHEFKLDDSSAAIDVKRLASSLEVFRTDGSPRPLEETPPLRALQGEVIVKEEEVIRTPATGKMRTRQVSSSPVMNSFGSIIGSISVVRDVTDQKLIEKKARDLNLELESRVAERTNELQTAIAALESESAERKRLRAEVMSTVEEEQLRVAADLHDGICQELVGIKLFAHLLQQKLRETDHPMAEEAKRIEDAIGGTTDNIRAVARGMNPVVADGEGLMHALRQLSEATATSHGIDCSFHCQTPVLIQNPKMANELYRIVQEAIYNAIRHSRAKRITVHMDENSNGPSLRVRDDGCGLPTDLESHTGMGLRVMRYRAEMIGAQFLIQSNRDGGTEVICYFAQSTAS